MEFVYTKNTGESKPRTLVVLQEPQKFFEGIDVTDMPEDEFAEFVNAYGKALDDWKQQSLAILQQFERNHSYRRFSPGGVSEATLQHV